jgi:hypothetical protein
MTIAAAVIDVETATNTPNNPSRRRVLSLQIGDYGIIAFAAALALISACIVYGGQNDTLTITIKGRDDKWTFPLDAQETLSVPGPLGDTLVEIRQGKAHILSSPCTNQNCIAAGFIRARGQWIACLPNGVMVSVEGMNTEGIDGAVW